MSINFTAKISVLENGKESKYDSVADANGQLSYENFSEYVRDTIIKVSKEVLAEEQSQGRFKDPSILVDGVKKPIEQVKPFGDVFIAEKIVTSTALTAVYKNILERSPKGMSSTYENYHVVIYNDSEVARTMEELVNWSSKVALKKGDRIRFVNITPYAGKLERNNKIQGNSGKGIKRKLSRDKRLANRGVVVRVPNGAYVLAEKASRKVLKGNISSRFEFINGKYLKFEALPKSTVGPNYGKIRRLRTNFVKGARDDAGRKLKGQYVYPCILLTVLENTLA